MSRKETELKVEVTAEDNDNFLKQLDEIFNGFNDLGEIYDKIEEEESQENDIDLEIDEN